MIHTYIEVPIKLPAGVTATVDVLGNLRLRCNVRDLTEATANAATDALVDACDDLQRAAAMPKAEVQRG